MTQQFKPINTDFYRTTMPATSKPLVEEIEPKFEWEKIEGCDILLVHLIGYLKENLKVQVTKSRNLRVIGERKGNDGKLNRFQKEFSLPEDYDVNGITAKFEGGVLKIKLPKVTGSKLQKEEQKQEVKNTSVPSAPADLNDKTEAKATNDEKEEAEEEKHATEKKYMKKKIEWKLKTKKGILLTVLILGVGIALGLRMLQSKGSVRKFVNDMWGVRMNNTAQNVTEKSCICEM